MSIRYGIGLALDPVFTARVYRARQLICGQYASWAAEMHMVYLPVAEYIQCSDSVGMSLGEGLSEIADAIREDTPQFPISNRGVASDSATGGHIFLDLAGQDDSTGLKNLKDAVFRLLQATLGPPLESRVVAGFPPSFPPSFSQAEYRPRLPLMQYAKLPAPLFRDAVEFAREVVADLKVPGTAKAWRLLLLRFESASAGDDWSGGSWAADLRWGPAASHRL